MSERLENLGLLKTQEQHARILSLKLKGLREQIHRAANPYKPLDQFTPGAVLVAAQEADRTASELAQLVGSIKALCAELGEPVPSFE